MRYRRTQGEEEEEDGEKTRENSIKKSFHNLVLYRSMLELYYSSRVSRCLMMMKSAVVVEDERERDLIVSRLATIQLVLSFTSFLSGCVIA